MKFLAAVILLSVLVVAAINSPILRPQPVRVPVLFVPKSGKGKRKMRRF